MLCLGNICRSPLAEGILRSKLPEKHFVDSAGTISIHSGEQADKRSILVAKKYGIDIKSHRARKITPEDFNEFDLILCMDQDNYANAMNLAKTEEQKKKISLILDYSEIETKEVPDPYWGDVEDFENVYHLLDEACETIAQKIYKSEL